MEFNWGLLIYTLIGVTVFSIPVAIKIIRWLKRG
jgi:hypothetical protein